MAKLVVDDGSLVSVANAIRAKAKAGEKLTFPEDFVRAVNAITGGDAGELEALIDESGVLESTDGTVKEKVEQLISLTNWKHIMQESIDAMPEIDSTLFKNTSAKNVSDFDYSRRQSFNYIFLNCTAIEDIELDMSSATVAMNMCAGCTNVKSIKLSNTGNVKTFANAFSNCSSLISLEELDFSGITTFHNLVYNCKELVTFKVVPGTIKSSFTVDSLKLSVESAKSIILGLKDYRDDYDNQFAHSLKLPDAIWARLESEEQIETAIGGYSWYDYVTSYLCWNA